MKLLHPATPSPRRRGSALLVSFLILMVLLAIVHQLSTTTSAGGKVARNDVAMTAMDLAIESALLRVYETLKTDAESAGMAEGGSGAPGTPGEDLGGELPGADPAAGGEEEAGATDSREDEWAGVDRTTINEVELRIFIQDEDSKINLLGMLTEDEEEADKVYERVRRVLDLFREDTAEDVDGGEADRLANAIREFMTQRVDQDLPKGALLTDDEEERDRGLPISLRELMAIEPFYEELFRDFRDEDGTIIHSLGSFLTVWSSVGTFQEMINARNEAAGADEEPAEGGEEDPAEPPAGDESGTPTSSSGDEPAAAGGGRVNVNTAPPVVLKALMDERDVRYRWWDEVIEYRNLEEESEDGEEEELDPILDEYGEEVVPLQIFDNLEELAEVPDWEDLEPITRTEIEGLLTVESHVFSIFITARRSTSNRDTGGAWLDSPEQAREAEDRGDTLVRTVRSVVWRREGQDGWEIVPLIRWEVLDHVPFEVLDYPEEDR